MHVWCAHDTRRRSSCATGITILPCKESPAHCNVLQRGRHPTPCEEPRQRIAHAQIERHVRAVQRTASALQCVAGWTAYPRRAKKHVRALQCVAGRTAPHAARRTAPVHRHVSCISRHAHAAQRTASALLRSLHLPIRRPRISLAPYAVRKAKRPHMAALPACRMTDVSALPAGLRRSPVRRESASASQRA